MALTLKDRVLETTTTTGTGSISLGGTQTGYQAFSVIGDGNTTYYTIQGVDSSGNPTGEWEVGLGTYTAAGNTLSRDVVYSSSNGGAKVVFSAGTKQVFCDLPAEQVGGASGVTSVTGTAPVVSSGGTTPAISMAKATTSVDGYLSSTDWNTFNNKGQVNAITSTDGSVSVTGTSTVDLSVAVAASTTNVIVQVRNTTGATLTKGTVVYISGATGQIPTVSKALATSDATSAQSLGMMSADLANNSNGYVTIIGLINDIDTSAFTDGAQLYLSSTTAGAVTATKQYAPAHLVYVGVVEYAHAVHGKIFVKVQNGYELDELHNVSAQTPSNGQTIIYDATTGLWNAANLTAGTGMSVTNGAGSITLTNTAPDQVVSLTAGSNVTVTGTYPNFTIAATGGGGSTSPAGATTQVQYNNAGAFGASATYTFDGTTVKSPNVETTGGVLADGAFGGTYVDGIVMDYDTVGAKGRISVGGADGISFYNGGIAGSLLGSVNNLGDWSVARFLDVGNGTLVGGTTNPLIAAAGSANGYVEVYCHNDNSGTSASSDFVAYPNNGADATGWVDLGVNSSTFSDVAYSITTANEGYLLMSNPSTATTATGNLVYATDSTGTQNYHQWYVGGFTQAKSAYKMQLKSTALDLTVPLNSTVTTGTAPFTVASTTNVANLNASSLNGATFAAPGAIGGTTPSTITGTTITANTAFSGPLNGTVGATTPSTGVFTQLTVNGANLNTAISPTGTGTVTISPAGALTINPTAASTINNTSIGATTASSGRFTNAIITASAGTTAPLQLTAGTNLATAAAGAFEYDGTVPFFSMAASSRGVIHTEQVVVLGTAYTLTSQTAAQKLFNASTNGAVTLPIGTYQFECFYSLSSMSATAGSFGFALGVGTAVIGSQGWWSLAEKSGTPITGANTTFSTYNTAANTNLTASTTQTAGYAFIKGIFRVTTAGTVIPQVSLTVAAAAIVGAQSYFKVSPISATATAATNLTVGNWS